MNSSSQLSSSPPAGARRRIGGAIGLRLVAAWAVVATGIFGITSSASGFGMTMEPSIISVVCDGSYGSIGRISGAGASEVINFAASPAAQFLPARSSTAGNYTVIWKCDPSQAGTQWNVTASGASSGRTASFSVVAEAPPLAPLPAAGTELLTNGGFETGSTAPWAIIDQSGSTTMTAASSGRTSADPSNRARPSPTRSGLAIRTPAVRRSRRPSCWRPSTARSRAPCSRSP